MNYSRAFTYMFEDKDWPSKILIAGLISLIPIIGQFYLFGWMVEIIRRVKAGRRDILPTTHFSYFLTLGLKLFVVALIYSIPLIIVSCLFGLISNTTRTVEGTSVTIVVSSMGFFGSLISLVVHIGIALLTTYATIKLAETDEIKACLNFSDGFETIKNNLPAFIIVELLMLLTGIIGSAGVIICFIGVIFTMPYATAVNGHLLGQLWGSLNTSENGSKSFRGKVNNQPEDIIQEAPFTRVEDIEKTIDQEEPEVKPIIIEPVIVDEPLPEENITEDVIPSEIVDAASEEEDNEQSVEKEDEKPDNDIPSFE